VPEPIASYLGHGLGHLCDVLGVWFVADTEDRRAGTLISQQEANWLAVPEAHSRPEAPVQVRVGLLGTARAGWKAALLTGDNDDIEASRMLTWRRMGPWTPPALVDKFRELDSWSQRVGVPPLVDSTELASISGLQDRGAFRASLVGAAA